MKREIVIVNKDNTVLKAYIEARENLIKEYKKLGGEEKFVSFTELNSIDTLVHYCDREITQQKLSNEEFKAVFNYNESVKIVEHNFVVLNDDRQSRIIESFQTKQERDFFVKENEDYKFEACDLKESGKNLKESLEYIEEKNCMGWSCFIKANSLYSNNIVIGFIER